MIGSFFELKILEISQQHYYLNLIFFQVMKSFLLKIEKKIFLKRMQAILENAWYSKRQKENIENRERKTKSQKRSNNNIKYFFYFYFFV